MITNFKINHLDYQKFQPIDNIYSFSSDTKGPFLVELYKYDKIILSKMISKEEAYGFKLNNLEYDAKYKIIIDKENSFFFKTAPLLENNFISVDNALNPIFYYHFSLKALKIKEATLAITGLGLYECSINDSKLGDGYLTPGFNDYDFYLRYQSYDVSKLLVNDNLISVQMADGWYKGRFGPGNLEAIWGDKYLLALKLIIKYDDGSEDIILSDDKFKCQESYIIKAGIYDGEYEDYTKKLKKDLKVKMVKTNFNLQADFTNPIVKKEEISPKLIITKSGNMLLDFGQNMVGFVKIKKMLAKGQRIRLTFGEVLQDGEFFNDNYRSANPVYEIIADGKKEEYFPRFSYYGFRYAKVEGLDEVDVNDFKGIVLYTDLRTSLECKTDSPKINRLMQNALWGQKGNFLDVPTDCPQRDERLGWTGDTQVFSRSAMYQMDCASFYDKFLYDLRLEQLNYFNGDIPMYAPSLKKKTGTGGAVWSDAAIIIPWNMYMFYADIEMLKKHYPMMKDYTESLIKKDENEGNKGLILRGFCFGDWLALDGVCKGARAGKTDLGFIMSIYYYNALKTMEAVSKKLGLSFEYYASRVSKTYEAILDEFYTKSGRLALDTQTAYILALHFNVYRDKNVLINQLKKRLANDYYKLKTGFTGTPLLIPTLLENNLLDEAYRILYNEEYPGWLYDVNMGATTIWERWDALLPNGKISGIDMNSFNHYAFGAVVEGIYANIAGLKPEEPGFRRVSIKPKFNYRLKKMNFSYESASGLYKVSFEIGKFKLHFDCEIPQSCSACLTLFDNNYELNAGTHHFELELPSSLIYKYSIDTALVDIVRDKKAYAILKQYLPECYRRLEASKEFLTETIRTLSYNPLMKITRDNLSDYEKALKEITVYE